MRFVSVSHELKVCEWPDCKETFYYKPRGVDNQAINTVSWGKNGTWVLLTQNFDYSQIVSLGKEAKHLISIQNVKHATCAAFQNTSSRRIAIGTSTGQLVIYDLKSKCIKQQCGTQQAEYFRVQHSAKDSHVLGACKDGKVYVYRVNSGNQIAALSVPQSRTVTSFRCHPVKTNIVGLCCERGMVAVWDYNVARPTLCYEAHRAPVTDVLIKSEVVISIAGDRRLSGHDYRSKRPALEATFAHTPTAFDLHSDGVSVAVGLTDGSIQGYDLRALRHSLGVLATHTTRINQIAFDHCSGAPTTSVISEENLAASACSARASPEPESFTDVYGDVPTAAGDCKPAPNANQSDSFMAALSLQSEAVSELDSISKLTADCSRKRASHLSAGPPPPPEDKADEIELLVPKTMLKARKSVELLHTHSTPIGYSSGFNQPSPIFPVGGASTALCEAEMRKIFRDEVKKGMDELKKQIDHRMCEMLMSTRQNVLGLQWTLSKLSVDLEEIREELLQRRKPL